MLRLLLMGPPGAGKGTQATKVVKKYHIPHISTGDILRKNIKEKTELGAEAQKYMDKGELVPDDLVIETACARLIEKDCQGGFLLDGFPRTIFQAERLDAFLADHKLALDKVINISVEKAELIDRLIGRRVCKSCGATYHVVSMPPKQEGVCDVCSGALYQRPDDTKETVLSRIEIYNDQTKPLIDYYEKAGIIAHIDGSIGVDHIFEVIISALGV